MYYFSNIFSRETWQKPIAYQRTIIKSPKSNGDSYLDIEQFYFDKGLIKSRDTVPLEGPFIFYPIAA
jgi:hypothetical protein